MEGHKRNTPRETANGFCDQPPAEGQPSPRVIAESPSDRSRSEALPGRAELRLADDGARAASEALMRRYNG